MVFHGVHAKSMVASETMMIVATVTIEKSENFDTSV